MTNLAIDVQAVSKKFGKTAALNNLELKLETGKFHVVLGPNGAGKSTLIKILNRSLLPSSGKGQVAGYDLTQDGSSFYQDVAYICEETSFLVPLNLSKVGELYKKRFPKWNHQKFLDLMQELKIDPTKTLQKLSRGQKVRFQVSTALAKSPKVILIDEISACLDEPGRFLVYGQLNAFVKSGGTVLAATNIANDVQYVDGSICYIHEGKILKSLDAKTLKNAFSKFRTRDMDSHEVFSHGEAVPVRVNSDDSRSYLIPNTALDTLGAPVGPEFSDHRSVTIDEVVSYLIAHPQGVANL